MNIDTPPVPSNDNNEVTKEEEIQVIRAFVEMYRVANNVPEPTRRDSLFEGSCFAYPGGEIAHLVERQLANTVFGYGSWAELNNGVVRKEVLAYIRSVMPMEN